MKLYYMPGACSLAPHIILHEIGMPFSAEKVGRDKKTETGEDFLGVNPKGYIPALRFDDGEVLTEGVVIQQYLADLKPETGLAPARGTRERLRVEEQLTFISSELHKAHSPLFTPGMPDEAKTMFRDKIGQRYELIDKQLAGGSYLSGDRFTIADAYLFTILNWAPMVGIDLSRWPNIVAYQQKIAARPAVRAALIAEGLAQ